MKIFYGVQGTGNGHISRSRTLAQALKKLGADVDYVFSGRDPKDYFDMADFGHFNTFKGLTFATSNGKIDLIKSVQPLRAVRLIKDFRKLDLSNYDCIISDFEPITAWAAHHQNRNCLGISNQSIFQLLKPKEYNLLARTIMKYYAPTTQPVGLHWFHFGHNILPPITERLDILPIEDGNILVYLPFESLGEIITQLNHVDGQQFICFHPAIERASKQGNIFLQPLGKAIFRETLVSCSGIITNTGFALISEALMLGKKILTKPVAGQFEQIYNAKCLTQLDMATVMESINQTKIKDWLDLPSPSPAVYPDVAARLASWIVSGQKESLSSLSKRLWEETQFPKHVNQRIKNLGYTI